MTLKKEIEEKMSKGLSDFTTKPIGNLCGDLCDWNKPSTFAKYNISPQEVENIVVKRVVAVSDQICSLIKERLEKIIYITRLNDCTCYTPIKNLTEELE